jgi:nucleotide-binding universal stress UspA family protein
MVSFKTILVPIDFSEPSKKALTYGLTLAGQFRAKVVIAHIVSRTDAAEEELDKIRRDVQDLVPAGRVGATDIQVIVKAGHVEAELLRIVAREGADLLVMGTRGRRNPGRWFIGSVTEHMLRKVSVPLVTVSHAEGEQVATGFIALERILYATDLSESSTRGLRYAIELARGTGAQLTMVHVVYYPDRALWARAGIPGIEDERAAVSEQMRASADSIRMEEGLRDMKIETLVVEGKPYEKILEIADDRAIDIIVMNLQSKSTFDRAFLGSTAERVVRLAHVPVLSIPLAAAPEQNPDESAVESGADRQR